MDVLVVAACERGITFEFQRAVDLKPLRYQPSGKAWVPGFVMAPGFVLVCDAPLASTPKVSFIPAQGNALGSQRRQQIEALKARLIMPPNDFAPLIPRTPRPTDTVHQTEPYISIQRFGPLKCSSNQSANNSISFSIPCQPWFFPSRTTSFAGDPTSSHRLTNIFAC